MLKDFLEHNAPAFNSLLRGHLPEIAARTGLHAQTVGRILRGEDGYSPETTAQVLSLAAEILDRKQHQAGQYGRMIREALSEQAN